ncbi:putative epimerase/dehydratase family protein [Talaromyces proteolyticus]|uniref:Epimerase/dehydratase family protein n=1 Tax=Talaromyces proteolyticus TaxID=1131652 RepID=A0AAD4PY08_9EURO|nr:putative epimerase/dehydratase family protein [Talaromyces proteolyticus]KAH8700625.1 putative epimerase/dehydratase family protein [Talaromyces proteolyticus]
MGSEKPAVLVVGGLGFIGRYLALYIHENDLASELRIVDKVLPQLAWLAPEFEDACSKERFVQADAGREQAYPRIFDRADGKQFDFVINCAGDTRYSQPEEVYQFRNHAMSIGLCKEVAKRGIPVYVEASTAMVYKGSGPSKESDKTDPWHNLAKWKLKVAEDIRNIPNLHWAALRFPHVYGEYDSRYFAIGICLARTHKFLERDLELLYSKDLKVNTLYVKDAARALWTVAEWRRAQGSDPAASKVFNVVDHNNTSQAHIGQALSEVFGLKVSFLGSLVSQLAKLSLDDVVDDMNEETLQAWADLVEEKKIARPGPISPFIDRDMIKDQNLCIDGTLFETTTGFKPERPAFNVDAVRDMVASYERMGWWP